MRPAASLPRDARPNFHAGKALAHQPWVTGPTITDARDGLGPLYNARTCLACHINGGRGPLPERAEQPLFAGVLRLSIPGKDRALGVVPEPTYGDQLQTQSTALAHQLRASGQDIALAKGEVAPEATIRVRWHASEFRYPDGTAVALRRPEALVSDLRPRRRRRRRGLRAPQRRLGLRAPGPRPRPLRLEGQPGEPAHPGRRGPPSRPRDR